MKDDNNDKKQARSEQFGWIEGLKSKKSNVNGKRDTTALQRYELEQERKRENCDEVWV